MNIKKEDILVQQQTGDGSEFLYHTLKEEKRLPDVEDEGGVGYMTCWTQNKLHAGMLLDYQASLPYAKIEAILENRDHKGWADKPEKKTNGFWSLKVSFVRRKCVNIE